MNSSFVDSSSDGKRSLFGHSTSPNTNSRRQPKNAQWCKMNKHKGVAIRASWYALFAIRDGQGTSILGVESILSNTTTKQKVVELSRNTCSKAVVLRINF